MEFHIHRRTPAEIKISAQQDDRTKLSIHSIRADCGFGDISRVNEIPNRIHPHAQTMVSIIVDVHSSHTQPRSGTVYGGIS